MSLQGEVLTVHIIIQYIHKLCNSLLHICFRAESVKPRTVVIEQDSNENSALSAENSTTKPANEDSNQSEASSTSTSNNVTSNQEAMDTSDDKSDDVDDADDNAPATPITATKQSPVSAVVSREISLAQLKSLQALPKITPAPPKSPPVLQKQQDNNVIDIDALSPTPSEKELAQEKIRNLPRRTTVSVGDTVEVVELDVPKLDVEEAAKQVR